MKISNILTLTVCYSSTHYSITEEYICFYPRHTLVWQSKSLPFFSLSG